MKRILAALDPSPGASDVLRAALDLALDTGARVSLLRVIEAAGEMPESDEALLSEARQQLRDLTREVHASRLDALLATTGTPWREICSAAQAGDADLVVVGTRRHGALERTLGTTAATVANRSDRSVLAVRGWRQSPARILVALDEGAHAAAVRDYAVGLARRTGARVHLFRAFEMPPILSPDMVGEYYTLEDELLAATRKALGHHEQLVPAELRDGMSTTHGAAAWKEICAAAREYDADLVVVGAHGYGLTDRLLGTTAAEVVNHADRSVLVVRGAWRE